MKTVLVRNLTRDTVVCPRCEVADNLFTRTRGLMGRAALAEDEGMWIKRCPSIHMFNMKFALDVIFVTQEGVVTDIALGIAPGKTFFAKNNAGKPDSAIEVAAGGAARSATAIGDKLAFES